ncbi:unnamed protein product [Chrysoparadoxa australica]
MGKEQKKGMKGVEANFLTRGQALRRLQISLKDFRRLCILKGIYPREPTKKFSGADKTYYHVKDVAFLAHEPLLDHYRQFKAFMKKLRRAAGRKNYADAQRREETAKPTYTLDHLVKERYPRFVDALRDLDDALSLVHMFASLPKMLSATAGHTHTCKKLVDEWSYYVAKSGCLSKCFVSIKGIYLQAGVQGLPITWLRQHQFTTHYPKDVDFRIMLTFLEFYETLLKFVLFRLYSGLGLQYPPTFDCDLEGAGAGMLAIKAQEGAADAAGLTKSGAGDAASSSSAGKAKHSGGKSKSTLQKASEKNLASLDKKMGDICAKDAAAAEAEAAEDEKELGSELTVPLEAAFLGQDVSEETLVLDQVCAQLESDEEKRKRLLRGLKVFFCREVVPKGWLEMVVVGCGGVVGWDGEGSPFSVEDTSITHQVTDRPDTGLRVKHREYVQPQWLLDSLNACMKLPVERYSPGCELPPHLSPFVDDTAEGYVPAYREELDKLKAAKYGQRSEARDKSSEEGSGEEGESSDEGEAPELDAQQMDEAEEEAAVAAAGLGGGGVKHNEKEEEKELAKIMMSKKAKRLYGRMQHGLGKEREKVERLKAKRKSIEAKYAQEAPPPKKSKKKNRKKTAE